MTEPTPTPDAPPVPPSTAPGSPPANALPASSPPAATKPEWLDAAHWDDKAGAIKVEDFGKHYAEVTAAAKTLAERTAGVPKDGDYKAELPADFKPPEGVTIKFDDKDPIRGPILAEARALAREIGVDQPTFSKLLGLQAKLEVAQHTAAVAAETARVAEETKKLGEKAKERTDAVGNWAKAYADRKGLTAEQRAELQLTASTAAGVVLLETVMADINGNVPGNQPPPPPKSAEVPQHQRWYPDMNRKAG